MRDERNHMTFLIRREAQERALASRADDPAVRRVHAELAERYAAQLRDLVPLSAA